MAHPVDLDVELAFLEQKRLVLPVMTVPPRTLPGLHDVLEHRMGPARLSRRQQHLERDDPRKIQRVRGKIFRMNRLHVRLP